jgi:nitric oxide reductase NorD protein
LTPNGRCARGSIFSATGEGTDRVWRQTRPERRDLAVSILLDVSRSTESAIPGHGHDGRA